MLNQRLKITRITRANIAAGLIAASLQSVRLFFIHRKGKSASDYRSYRYQNGKPKFGHSTPLDAQNHKMKHVVKVFPTHTSSGSSEEILTPLENIHVRSDIVVRSDGR